MRKLYVILIVAVSMFVSCYDSDSGVEADSPSASNYRNYKR
jgi:hypothetical protein